MTPYFLQAWGRNPGVPWAGGLQATSQKVQPTPAPPRTCEPALQLASTPFLPEQMVLPHLLLPVSGFAFALGCTSQLKVRPHGEDERKGCPAKARGFHAVIQSSASSPSLGSPAGRRGVFDERLCVRQELHLITGDWQQIRFFGTEGNLFVWHIAL